MRSQLKSFSLKANASLSGGGAEVATTFDHTKSNIDVQVDIIMPADRKEYYLGALTKETYVTAEPAQNPAEVFVVYMCIPQKCVLLIQAPSFKP